MLSFSAISLTVLARCICSCAVPCEKFKRTTLTPTLIKRAIFSSEAVAGPKVATILVLRCMIYPKKQKGA